MRLPNTPGEFLDRVLKSGRAWAIEIRSDGVPEFWLKKDKRKYAVVTYEHKSLWVNIYDDQRTLYDFEFIRLREDWPNWSWSRQVGDKCWAKPEHRDFLRHLESIFPKDRKPSND